MWQLAVFFAFATDRAPDGKSGRRNSNLRRSQRAIALPRFIPLARLSKPVGLMGYATDRVDMRRQVSAHTGQILKGATPADPPV